MNWGSAIPSAIWLAALGGAAAMLIAAYLLKTRRRKFEVPFSPLWQKVLAQSDERSLWRRFRRFWSFLIALLVALCIWLAMGHPRIDSKQEARSIVFLVDVSASMLTSDATLANGETGTRISVAREKLTELLDTVGDDDAAMIVQFDSEATPLSRFTSDKAALLETVSKLTARATPTDVSAALSLAVDALSGRTHPTIVILGDGNYEKPANVSIKAEDKPNEFSIDLRGVQMQYVAIGQPGDNVGIVSFNVRRYASNRASYEVYLELLNSSQAAVKRRLTLFSGDTAVDVKEIEIPAGKRFRQIYSDLANMDDPLLKAELSPLADGKPDAFTVDDAALALLPPPKNQKVLLVTDDNLFLEGAMLVYDNIRVDKLSPKEFDQSMQAGSLAVYDVIVFDAVTPEHTPDSNLVYFAPSGPASPFTISRTLSNPRITSVVEAHPVMRWLTLGDVNFDQVSAFSLSAERRDVALASSVREPIIVARQEKRRKIVACGFNLRGTDIVMRVAFPLFLVNIFDWMAGDDSSVVATHATGERTLLPLDATTPSIAVTTPDGTKVTAATVDGKLLFYPTAVGRYEAWLNENNGVPFVANLANPSESQISAQPNLNLGDQNLPEPSFAKKLRSPPFWSGLVLMALLVVLVEWITYHRRVTV